MLDSGARSGPKIDPFGMNSFEKPRMTCWPPRYVADNSYPIPLYDGPLSDDLFVADIHDSVTLHYDDPEHSNRIIDVAKAFPSILCDPFGMTSYNNAAAYVSGRHIVLPTLLDSPCIVQMNPGRNITIYYRRIMSTRLHMLVKWILDTRGGRCSFDVLLRTLLDEYYGLLFRIPDKDIARLLQHLVNHSWILNFDLDFQSGSTPFVRVSRSSDPEDGDIENIRRDLHDMRDKIRLLHELPFDINQFLVSGRESITKIVSELRDVLETMKDSWSTIL